MQKSKARTSRMDAARLAEMWIKRWHQAHCQALSLQPLTTLRTPIWNFPRCGCAASQKHTKVAWLTGRSAGFFMGGS